MLTRRQYDMTINSFPYVLRLKLQGTGEPFANNLLYDFIEDACSRGVWCEVVTNGSLLDMERLSPLKGSRLFRLVFSFDAADKETFEKIRLGSCFEEILEKIGRTASDSTIDVGALMLVQRNNKDQVKDVIRLLAGKGAKSFRLQCCFFDLNEMAQGSKMKGAWVIQHISGSDLASLQRYARRLGVRMSISRTLHDRSHVCPWPWMGVFVGMSGNIMPCCRINDDGAFIMGNINEEDIDVIWNSERYREFRSRHKMNDPPDVCRGCYSTVCIQQQ